MNFVADVHIHSHYSRATSKDLDFEHLARWAQLKGVNVVGTGDISHPGWLQEMKDKLEPAEEGLFRLKDEIAQVVQADVPPACQAPVRFMLAGEISSIYKKNDRVRKVHNVIFAPSLAAVEKIQAALEKIGNIRSDGRPILGLPSRDLLEIILGIDPACYLIPAHIWTPWFSLLGSKSGYDSVEECFDDLASHIFALETGLSSDPPMNWRVSALDRYTLVSNSDAHSAPKLAREANVFETELSYPAIFAALKSGDGFWGTLEFFPEEGKYHNDGHRKCAISWPPPVTLAHDAVCPVCGKKVTVGVMHRVEMLADRPEGARPALPRPFQSLIPLPEILAEVHRTGPGSKAVQQSYDTLLARLGPELSILRELPLADIGQVGGPVLAEGIRRVRSGDLTIAAGYDGEYGVIKLFGEQERAELSAQLSLFAAPGGEKRSAPVSPPEKPAPARLPGAAPEISRPAPEESGPAAPTGWVQPDLFGPPQPAPAADDPILAGLNEQQRAAVLYSDGPLIIVAGPGTGKTRTLTHRLAYLVSRQGAGPEAGLAITFTNKAAREMAQRLRALLPPAAAGRMVIKTFHALGTKILQEDGHHLGLEPDFSIYTEPERQALLKQLYPQKSDREIADDLERISTAKNQLLPPDAPELSEWPGLAAIYQAYDQALRQDSALDFDDLLLLPVRLFETRPDVLETYRRRFRWLAVDEYQDTNLAQYRLLRLLATPQTDLCVIGDPDQAIYGFRGARRDYFLRFQEDFPGAKTISLHRNYRSTQLILDASGQVISRSPGRPPFDLRSDIIDPARLVVYHAPTGPAEAESVVHRIEQMVGGTSYFSLDSGRVDDDDGAAGRSFADFAVLYRLHAQSQPLIEAFERSGMPYQVSHTPLYEQRAVKQVLAYLGFIRNPRSRLYLDTILASVKLPGKAEALDTFLAAAGARDGSLWAALLAWADLPFKPAQRQRLGPLVELLLSLAEAAGRRPVTELIERVQAFVPGLAGDDELQAELRRRAAPFEARLDEFLESTALFTETDAYDPRADRVTLMTLHAAKGLEFPVVFIVGCEDGLLPCRLPGKDFDPEEERRLFYVGMTRAQQRLFLSHARSRYLFGREQANPPSPFLADIEAALKEMLEMAARKPRPEEPPGRQLSLF